MKKLFNIIILSVIILLLFGISVSGGKKGIGGPGGCPDIPDLPMLYNVLGVDWAYTWATCLWPMPSVEYIPMVRSIHGFGVELAQQVVNHYGAGGYWLVGNEPDNQWQDNLTPMGAAVAYGGIVNVILSVDPTARIILGNFSNPSQYFREAWLAQFKAAWMTKWNENVTTHIAGWGVHAYAHRYPSETQQNAIDRVKRQLLAWKAESPDLELWVTEYGNLWETDIETMRWMTPWLEENVDRYAYFYFGDASTDWDCTSLYNDPWPLPMLTELGEQYRLLPMSTPTKTMVKSVTPMDTPTKTLTPTKTSIPTQASITQTSIVTMTPTRVPTITPTEMPLTLPTPPPNPPMPNTLLGVAQEELRVMWRLERSFYALATIIMGVIAWIIKSSTGDENNEE